MKFWRDTEPHFARVAESEALEELWQEISKYTEDDHGLFSLLRPDPGLLRKGRKRRKLAEDDSVEPMEAVIKREVQRTSYLDFLDDRLQLLRSSSYPFSTPRKNGAKGNLLKQFDTYENSAYLFGYDVFVCRKESSNQFPSKSSRVLKLSENTLDSHVSSLENKLQQSE